MKWLNFSSVQKSYFSVSHSDDYLSLKRQSELPQNNTMNVSKQNRITDFRFSRFFEHLIYHTYCRNQLRIRNCQLFKTKNGRTEWQRRKGWDNCQDLDHCLKYQSLILKENHTLVKNTRSRVGLPGLQVGTYHFSMSVSLVINENNSMTILSRVVIRNKYNIHKEQNKIFGIQ